MATLDGLSIVVTRPAHQAETLCEMITQQGGSPIRFPVLEIADPKIPLDPVEVRAVVSGASLIIFISPNAVDYGVKIIKSAGGFPVAAKVAAVGQGSARRLQHWGHPADVFPSERFDSEALLAMDELQSMTGKQVVIFRGEGGREHLAEILRQRGAAVKYIECYRRVKPANDTTELSSRLAAESVDAVVVTSNEGLQNLHDMLTPDDRQKLLAVQLFVVSDRGRQLAREMGFSRDAIIVSKASDQGIMDSLLQWKQH